MNAKRIWLLLPTILLPYFTLLLVAIVILYTKVQVFAFIIDHVFQENGLYILAILLILCLIAVAFSIAYFVLSIRKKWNPVSLAKCAMLIKWIQVPAYAAIFTLGFASCTTAVAVSLSELPHDEMSATAAIAMIVRCFFIIYVSFLYYSFPMIVSNSDFATR